MCLLFSLGEFLKSLEPSLDNDNEKDGSSSSEKVSPRDANKSGSKVISLSSNSTKEKNMLPLRSSRQSDGGKEDGMSKALSSSRSGDRKSDMNSSLKSRRSDSDKQSRIAQDAFRQIDEQDGKKQRKRNKGNRDQISDRNISSKNAKRQRNDEMQNNTNIPMAGGNIDAMMAAYQQNMMQMMMQMMGGKGAVNPPPPYGQFNMNMNANYRGGKGATRGGRGGRGSMHTVPPTPPPTPNDKDGVAAHTDPNEESNDPSSEWNQGKGHFQGRGWGSKGRGFRGKGGWKGGRGRGHFEHKTWVRPPDTESELVNKRIDPTATE